MRKYVDHLFHCLRVLRAQNGSAHSTCSAAQNRASDLAGAIGIPRRRSISVRSIPPISAFCSTRTSHSSTICSGFETKNILRICRGNCEVEIVHAIWNIWNWKGDLCNNIVVRVIDETISNSDFLCRNEQVFRLCLCQRHNMVRRTK